MLVFLTHTTILNETQVPKVSDSTMIVELEPAYSFRFGWKSMCKQTAAKTRTLSLILPFCLIEEITFTLQELLSHLYPLPLDEVVITSLQLHRPQRADFQSMFCNLPKENHPKSSYDMILELKERSLSPSIKYSLHSINKYANAHNSNAKK